MPGPFDYTLKGPSPLQTAFGGYAQGLAFDAQQQNLDMNAAREQRAQELHPLAVHGAQLGLERSRLGNEAAQIGNEAATAALEQQKKEASRQEEFLADMASLAEKGKDITAEDIARISTKYPEHGQSIAQSYAAMKEPKQAAVRGVLGQTVVALRNGDVETAKELLKDFKVKAENSGDAAMAATADAGLKVIEANPDAALSAVGLALYDIDPKLAKLAMPGGLEGKKVSRSEFIGPNLAKIIYDDTSVAVKDITTGEILTGADADAALAAARQADIDFTSEKAGGRRAASLDAELQGSGAVKVAEGLGKAQADMAKDTIATTATLASSIANYERAITAIDNGAQSGVIQKYLPNITQSSAELESALNAVGIDVINSATFGALNATELKLALDTEGPRNLPPAELRKWLADRLEAKQKLRAELVKQALFLSDPRHTIKQWIELQGATALPDQQQTSTPQTGQQTSGSSYLSILGGGQ